MYIVFRDDCIDLVILLFLLAFPLLLQNSVLLFLPEYLEFDPLIRCHWDSGRSLGVVLKESGWLDVHSLLPVEPLELSWVPKAIELVVFVRRAEQVVRDLIGVFNYVENWYRWHVLRFKIVECCLEAVHKWGVLIGLVLVPVIESHI